MIHALTPLTVMLYGAILYWGIGRHSNDKPRHLLFCVAMGIVSAGVALALEYLWYVMTHTLIDAHPGFVFLESFIGIALIEEAAKWAWLPLWIRRWPVFDRYTDGILYACGIAAGFNLVEGTLYVVTEGMMSTMMVRSFTAIPAHFLFAIVMGFLFSRYRFESKRFLGYSLFIPVVLHGMYDFFIFQSYSDLLMGGALIVMAGVLGLSVWLCRMALRADKQFTPGDLRE